MSDTDIREFINGMVQIAESVTSGEPCRHSSTGRRKKERAQQHRQGGRQQGAATSTDK